MPKKMLINALHAEEARVAIVEDGRLMDLGIEIAGREQTRGNVYKGTVVRVEPGLQAAFIDIGLKKLGFLQMGELHPDFWQWRDDIPPENRNRRPRIQEVLRRGQELIVQVEKGERDMKGAAVTSYLSLPGRYMVLMPGSDSSGVSRKVEAEGERKKLKEMAAELQIPEGIGYIIRTEALGKKQTELAKDCHYLLKLNESIREAAKKVKGPALIYQESDLIIRTIRDYFTAEIDEVLVDSVEVFEQARAFFKEVMPRMAARVKLHQEKRPIFSRYQLEEQIDGIYEKKVGLKSGGSLVIEPAEALVSIDVNSGKSTGEKGVEDTAFKTNLEAAEEAARQLRLRDLGGLIVIDFIDMRDRKHNAEVEKTLKHALKSDKARVTVGKISQFGLLEMSRQRIRQTANEAVYLECPHCEGRGRIKSVEAMALSFLRKVHAAAAKGTIGEVRGGLPLEVAYYLLNRKKRDLARIESDYDIEVTIKGKPSFLMNQIELELIKREKGAAEGNQADAAPAPLVAPVFAPELGEEAGDEPEEGALPAAPPEQVPEAEAPAEGGKKRKRRRGRKKGGDGEQPAAEEAATAAESTGVDEEPAEEGSPEAPAEEGGPAAEEGASGASRKRKRRRKRGKNGSAASPEGPVPVGEDVAGEAAAEAESVAPEGEEQASDGADEGKKKRRRRRRGKKRGAETAGEMAAPAEIPEATAQPPREEPVAPLPAAGDEAAPAGTEKKPRRGRGRASAPAASDSATSPETAPAEIPSAGPPAEETGSVPPAPKKRPSRAKKGGAVTVTGEAEPLAAPETGAEPPPAAGPAPKKRAPRKKKESPELPAVDPIPAAEAAEPAPAARKRGPRKKAAAAPDETS